MISHDSEHAVAGFPHLPSATAVAGFNMEPGFVIFLGVALKGIAQMCLLNNQIRLARTTA